MAMGLVEVRESSGATAYRFCPDITDSSEVNVCVDVGETLVQAHALPNLPLLIGLRTLEKAYNYPNNVVFLEILYAFLLCGRADPAAPDVVDILDVLGNLGPGGTMLMPTHPVVLTAEQRALLDAHCALAKMNGAPTLASILALLNAFLAFGRAHP